MESLRRMAGPAPAMNPAAARASWMRDLLRPVAETDEQARFWVRHARIGVMLTSAAACCVLAYARTTAGSERWRLSAIALVAGLLTPILLAFPIRRIAQHRMGICFFYGWSACATALLGVGAAYDGGTRSVLTWLLFLPLAFAAMGYPPLGVAMTGCMIIGTYLGVAGSAGVETASRAAFCCSVLILVTAACAFAARNRWRVQDQQDELTRRLAELAEVDGLTGCLNRRAFGRLMEETCTIGSCATTALLVIDLDHFKQVNDSRGHVAGDLVLGIVADALRRSIRAGDLVARIGGDEFAVIAPALSAPAAFQLAERCRAAIERAAAPYGVTASIGVVADASPIDPVDLFTRADHGAYEAKRAGRNRTIAAVA